MKILFLSRWYPYPFNNGSKIRAFNLIKSLASAHQITLISYCQEPVSEENIAVMRRYCEVIETVTYKPFRPDGLKAKLAFLSAKPRSVVDTYNAALAGLVQRYAAQSNFDVVVASEQDMAPYALQLSGPRKILEDLELALFKDRAQNQKSIGRKWRRQLTWWKLTKYVSSLSRQADALTVVSAEEKEVVRQIVGDDICVAVIPNGVDTTHNAPANERPKPDSLIYTGALSYHANFDAIDYFLRDIFPHILEKRPQVRLSITGKTENIPLDNLVTNEQVTFTGYLDQIQPAVRQSWMSIVPLRVGGGTRLKILESLALGTPVVSSAKGVEGLDLTPGEDLLVADEPADFAAAVLKLLSDRELRRQLSVNGRQKVEALYDWQKIGRTFNRLVEDVVQIGE